MQLRLRHLQEPIPSTTFTHRARLQKCKSVRRLPLQTDLLLPVTVALVGMGM
jgi:hypothetical protein